MLPAAWAAGTTQMDIPYAGTTDPRQMLDIYWTTAANSTNRVPLIVWIHGGGWNSGNRANPPSQLTELRAHGFSVASIGYRLSGQAIWPAQWDDVRAAISHLKSNSSTYNIDPDRLVVTGASAGGSLAMMIGAISSPSDSWRVAAVISFFGMSTFAVTRFYPTAPPNGAIQGVLGCWPTTVGTPCYTTAVGGSPLEQVTANSTPLLMLHGTNDQTVPARFSELMQAAAISAGTDSTLVTVAGMGHNLRNVLNGQSPSPLGNLALMNRWIATRLDGGRCDVRAPLDTEARCALTATSTAAGACVSWCRTNTNAWANKCSWANCRGCFQCPQAPPPPCLASPSSPASLLLPPPPPPPASSPVGVGGGSGSSGDTSSDGSSASLAIVIGGAAGVLLVVASVLVYHYHRQRTQRAQSPQAGTSCFRARQDEAKEGAQMSTVSVSSTASTPSKDQNL